MPSGLVLLTDDLTGRVLAEAHELLRNPGVKVLHAEALHLLAEAGAPIDESTSVARIPARIVSDALKTVPREFHLHDSQGCPKVHYGKDSVQFDPGSAGVAVLDAETLRHRDSTTPDLVRLVKVAEQLPQYDAQSTAVVCTEVPKAIQDLYRLYVVLLYSGKPIVTGAFSNRTVKDMVAMLAILSGGEEALRRKPRAVFDVCPTPPLLWSDFGCGNLIALARAGVPAELVSMPLAGAAAPVTLLGSVTQHAAESLAGIAIHQLACPGSPIVWGGAPAIFDMRRGSTPMGAIETAMLDCACAQVGKSLGLPTHAYLGATDSKVVDAQAGLESGISAMLGALCGINMISGAGMLDSLLCQSAEKLVLDAEGIAMARRLLDGVKARTESLATALFAGVDFEASRFLKQKATRQLFRQEQHLPGEVIDRDSLAGWTDSGALDTFARARACVTRLLASYRRPALDPAMERELTCLVEHLAAEAGMDRLPELRGEGCATPR